ncbi:M61 family metallopeptidase [Mucilaginibacter gotjawali]|uniref:Metalloprotease with PDZ domain n=1 Tax=Mucilaginibacter gotjawali TaxID=1550579 RepID=A0A839SCN2_9SPHI|nr:PDZ domain-containing protein [Mucilaginibacter gotjawali]MBB3055072.1 putative metalloprotease with PDZ domain [Mucilaginibacter gotjawali]
MKTIKLAPVLLIMVFFMDVNTSKATQTTGATHIAYTVTFPEAQAHYADIEMNISGLHQNGLDLKMPVWTPGSYLVREFAKNIESFNVSANGKTLASPKTSKNCWHVNTAGLSAINVKYRVYCFEISVRTSFVDASHGFLSTTGIFIYPDKMLHLPSTVHIVPYKGWTKVSTSLDMVNNDPFTRYSPNFDILFDSPIEIGNQDVFGFDAAGVKYEVCMVGGGNYDKERLKTDMAKIVETETNVFGENPNKHYVFIVHNYLRGGGGLEHLSSTTLGASRDSYATESGYRNFLGLVAHEHFHLWNVKRLRPFVLGPFDYDKENYTTDLWIAEGFTAYYQNRVLRHANLVTPDIFLTTVAAEMSVMENQPGAKIQPLAEASYDAWIKAYRPNENSINSTISYYDKGAEVATLLDLEIINDSKGKYCLNDVMKYMYNTYYKGKKRGYKDIEFKHGLEKFAGKNLDDFYAKYVTGLAPIDYNHYLGYAGYKVTDELVSTNDPTLGITFAANNPKKIISSVLRGSAAWIDGINVNDELTAVDGAPVTDAATILNGKKPGDKITVTVLRDGLPLTLPVTLLRNNKVNFKVEALPNPTPQQLVVQKKWLGL